MGCEPTCCLQAQARPGACARPLYKCAGEGQEFALSWVEEPNDDTTLIMTQSSPTSCGPMRRPAPPEREVHQLLSMRTSRVGRRHRLPGAPLSSTMQSASAGTCFSI